MVVLSATAAMEARLPQSEADVIAHQLRINCEQLMSDREGQEVLLRLLRSPQENVSSTVQKAVQRHCLSCSGVHAKAMPAQLLETDIAQFYQFINHPIDAALLAPHVSSRIRVRAPDVA